MGNNAATVGFPVYDGHGNMVMTLSKSGEGWADGLHRSYDVWGNVRWNPSSSTDVKQRYCANLGHVEDDESGLIYMRARFYEPWTGRFVSEDPVRHGSNWSAYCSSDPVNKFDRSGTIEEYEWISSLFKGPDWLINGMREAFRSGGLEGFLEYINENWRSAVVAFGVGGSPQIAARGMLLRIWMRMAVLEEDRAVSALDRRRYSIVHTFAITREHWYRARLLVGDYRFKIPNRS